MLGDSLVYEGQPVQKITQKRHYDENTELPINDSLTNYHDRSSGNFC